MRIRTLFYVIKQGFASLFKNKWYSLASIATISACLFLFGICFSVIANIRHMVEVAEEGVSVTVLFNEDTTDVRKQEIGSIINARPEVNHIVFVDADTAWEGFKKDYLGEYADGFTENPLETSESYEIYLNDVSKQGELVEYLESIDGVRQVNRSEITANAFSGFEKLITYVSVVIIAILLGVSIFLISNTITIGISVRKEEIAIMKYVGATDFFVRAPFIIEGILIGAIGSILPLGIIYFSYQNVIESLLNRFTVLKRLLSFLPVRDVFIYLFPISIVVGLGIGFFGSMATVRKHLHV